MTAGSPEEDSDDDEVPQSTLLRLRRPMGLGLTQQNAVSEVIAETHSAALISGAPLSPGDRILRIDGISVEDGCCPLAAALDYEAQVRALYCAL
jgi:predicted metalloprotease with PDZ domain